MGIARNIFSGEPISNNYGFMEAKMIFSVDFVNILH